MINKMKIAIIFLLLEIGLCSAGATKPAMTIEFSKDGFIEYIRTSIVPWMFNSCQKLNDDGMKYNYLTLHDTEYNIDIPVYGNAKIDLGDADEYFSIEIDAFNVTINTDFDYKPRNEDELQGFAIINLDNMNITFDIIIFTA